MLERMDAAQKTSWGELSGDEKAEVMAMQTGQGFVSHDIAPDRPLLPKPKPEYVSSREMLEMLWRRSAFAPIDKMISLEYALTYDLEMLEFQNWILAVLALGLLPISVKGDNGSYLDARINAAAYSSLAAALLKTLPVSCYVRTVADGERLFPSLAPTVLVDRELWFKRSDLDALPCDDAAVARVSKMLAGAEGNSADTAETAAAINGAFAALAGRMAAPAVPAASPQAALVASPSAEPDPETVAEHDDAQSAPAPVQAPGNSQAEPVKRKRGRPETVSIPWKNALRATLVDMGIDRITDAGHLEELTEIRLIEAGNGGKDEKNKGLIPESRTTKRKGADEVWAEYNHGATITGI